MYGPKVSIIATFYNSDSLGDYATKTMGMLLNQTYQNLEIICVNDGSVDTTLGTLKRFAACDDRIILVNKKNEKYAQYSKAAGQQIASGDWCLLFDHDDEISLDAIEHAVAAANQNPDADIVSLNVESCSSEGKLIAFYNLDIRSEGPQFIQHEISGYNYLKKTVGKFDIHIRGLVKTPLFKKFSYAFSEPLLNADEFVERQIYSSAKKICNCKGVYRYFQHENSSAKSLSLKRIDIVRTDVLLRDFFISQGVYEARRNTFEKNSFRSFIEVVKIYHHFRDEMSIVEKKRKCKLLLAAFKHLNKKEIITGESAAITVYRSLLLSNFKLLLLFYRIKM